MGDRICSILGCENSAKARGWCGKHYQRWANGSDPTVPSKKELSAPERFWAKVEVGDCWTWTGGRDWDGYGIFTDGGTRRAHRWAYEYLVGTIPPGAHLDHLCRNTSCVNPDHLEAVTPRENTMRSPIAPAAVNVAKTKCSAGHDFDGSAGGQRTCRQCAATYSRRHSGWDDERIAATPIAIAQAKRTHCPHGHEYDSANTYIHSGQRKCRTCRRERERERSKRRTA